MGPREIPTATGQGTELPADVVDVAYARALRNHDRIRATGAYGEAEVPVPADAGAQAKYLSILGRGRRREPLNNSVPIRCP